LLQYQAAKPEILDLARKSKIAVKAACLFDVGIVKITWKTMTTDEEYADSNGKKKKRKKVLKDYPCLENVHTMDFYPDQPADPCPNGGYRQWLVRNQTLGAIAYQVYGPGGRNCAYACCNAVSGGPGSNGILLPGEAKVGYLYQCDTNTAAFTVHTWKYFYGPTGDTVCFESGAGPCTVSFACRGPSEQIQDLTEKVTRTLATNNMTAFNLQDTNSITPVYDAQTSSNAPIDFSLATATNLATDASLRQVGNAIYSAVAELIRATGSSSERNAALTVAAVNGVANAVFSNQVAATSGSSSIANNLSNQFRIQMLALGDRIGTNGTYGLSNTMQQGFNGNSNTLLTLRS